MLIGTEFVACKFWRRREATEQEAPKVTWVRGRGFEPCTVTVRVSLFNVISSYPLGQKRNFLCEVDMKAEAKPVGELFKTKFLWSTASDSKQQLNESNFSVSNLIFLLYKIAGTYDYTYKHQNQEMG